MGRIIATAYVCGIPIEQIEEKALRLSNMRNLVKLLATMAVPGLFEPVVTGTSRLEIVVF